MTMAEETKPIAVISEEHFQRMLSRLEKIEDQLVPGTSVMSDIATLRNSLENCLLATENQSAKREKMIEKSSVRGLLESLRSRKDSGQRTMGGGMVGGPDGFSKMWGGEIIWTSTNPDGSSAAELIEALLMETDTESAIPVPETGFPADNLRHVAFWLNKLRPTESALSATLLSASETMREQTLELEKTRAELISERVVVSNLHASIFRAEELFEKTEQFMTSLAEVRVPTLSLRDRIRKWRGT